MLGYITTRRVRTSLRYMLTSRHTKNASRAINASSSGWAISQCRQSQTRAVIRLVLTNSGPSSSCSWISGRKRHSHRESNIHSRVKQFIFVILHMKEGVFEESVEILEDYVMREGFVVSPTIHKKAPPLKIKQVRVENKEEAKNTAVPFRFRQPEEEQSEYEEEEEVDSLIEYCKRNADSLVYRKFNNQTCNKLRSFEYAASVFLNSQRPRNYSRPSTTEKMYSLEQLLSHSLKIQTPKQDTKGKLVSFDSNFQSGNLFAVYKIAHNQYDLILQNDVNSKGNLQWFYFSVSVEYPMEIKFNIVNMLKYDSLFNYGMQVAVFSEKRNRKTGEGWTRGGKKISYQKSQLMVEYRKKFYYTLSFSYDFKSEDKVYFAHSYPYTYSRLNELLFNLCNNPIKGKFCKRQILGSTLMGLNIECLTLSYQYSVIKDNRKLILVMARQHPGQTVGSWVAEGFVEQIVKKTKESQYLKKNYLIKVIPMINPDGVAIGNYRSNLSGSDLNRNWHTQRKALYPQIVAVKNYITQLTKDRKVKIIIDLHGHSKKMQTFYYGNSFVNPQVPRLFPYLCSKINPEVNFDECVFTCSEQRKNTARMWLSGMVNTPNVYTYECSFFGGLTKGSKKYSYTIDDYKKLGTSLVDSIYEYCNEESEVHKKYLKQLCANLNLLKTGDKSSCSESNPDDCELKDQERQQIKNVKPAQEKSAIPISKRHSRMLAVSQQKNSKRCRINRSRNSSARLTSAFTQQIIEKRQTQLLLQYRKTIEKFQNTFAWKGDHKPNCQDKEIQVDIGEQDADNRSKPLKSRVIKNGNAKILFSIEVKKKSASQIANFLKISTPIPSAQGWMKSANSKFISRGCQTDFKKASIPSDRQLSRLLEDQIQSFRSRPIKTASKLQPIKSISQHFM